MDPPKCQGCGKPFVRTIKRKFNCSKACSKIALHKAFAHVPALPLPKTKKPSAKGRYAHGEPG